MFGLQNKHQKGFTLVELVIVIVILGILSVTAAPRFLDFQTDATIAKLSTMKTTFETTTKLVKAKALIAGLDSGQHDIDIDGTAVRVVSGFPQSAWGSTWSRLLNAGDYGTGLTSTELCTNDWCVVGFATSVSGEMDNPIPVTGYILHIWPEGYSRNSKCTVHYNNKEDGNTPLIFMSTSGC